jgi:hypothetical protein
MFLAAKFSVAWRGGFAGRPPPPLSWRMLGSSRAEISRSRRGESMALTRRTLVLGLAATIAGGCAGEKSPVTADNAKRITRGMSEGEVMGLLGRPALQATQTLPPPINVTGARATVVYRHP